MKNVDTPDATRSYSSPSAGAPPPYEDDVSAVSVDEKASLETPAASVVSRAIPAVQEAGKETLETIKSQLATAQAELVKLKDSGLRQRVVPSESSEKKPAPELAQAVKQTADGVSVQIVALLCLLSFLLAYFFF